MRCQVNPAMKTYGTKVAAELAGIIARPRLRLPPKLKRHPLGVACVAFKVKGRRVWRYFGPFGSEAAAAKYRAFLRVWPSQLVADLPTGKWPARRMLTHDGRTQSLARWAKEIGITASCLKWRLDVAKWPVERALTTPKVRPRFARS